MTTRCPFCKSHPDSALTIHGVKQDYHMRICADLQRMALIDFQTEDKKSFFNTRMLLMRIARKK